MTNRILDLTLDCCGRFTNPRAAARLVFGTMAQESLFRYRRQIGFSPNTTTGAFGLAQVERGSIGHSLDVLIRRPAIRDNALAFLGADTCATNALDVAIRRAQDGNATGASRAIMRALQLECGDPLSVLFCRLHYLWFTPRPIPDTLTGAAEYWKTFYNTSAGKGTPHQWMRNWETYCAGPWGDRG